MTYLLNEPIQVLDKTSFNQILLWAVEIGASDIHIQPFTPICAQINQRLEMISPLEPSDTELNALVDVIFGEHAMGVLKQGDSGLNDNYSIQVDRRHHKRFRINASPCFIRNCEGVQITARTIREMPPSLDELDVEPEIRDIISLSQGLALFTGTMGTGKSTLLASLVKSVLENPDARKHIITAESPIEYVYDAIPHQGSIIAPLAIPRQLKTFHAAVVEATRRKPNIFVLGEARELNTFKAVIEASQLGMLVMTTLHTNSVPETMNRIINQFHKDEQAFQKTNIVDALRLIVSQTLLPSRKGGLIALREILPLSNSKIRNTLMKTPIEDISTVTRELVSQYGKSMFEDAIQKYDDGMITSYQLERIKQSFGEY